MWAKHTSRLHTSSHIWTDVKKDDLILVNWVDPQAQSGWVSSAEAIKLKVATCKTLGYYISYTEDVLVVAQTHGIDGKETEFNNLQSINKGCIRSIYSVTLGAKVRGK